MVLRSRNRPFSQTMKKAIAQKTNRRLKRGTFKRHRPSGSGLETPGDDFYKAINGHWLATTKIPPTSSAYGVSEEVEEMIDDQCWTILESVPKGSPLGCLTESILDLSTREKALATVKRILASLETITSKEEVAVVLGEFLRYKIPGIFHLLTQYENKNGTNYSLVIGTGTLGLPDSSFYFEGGFGRSAQLASYKRMLKRLGNLLGLPKLACVVQLERVLAGVLSKTGGDIFDTKLKGSELEERFPHIPFDSLFQGAKLSSWQQRIYYVESMRWVSTLNKMFHYVELDRWKLLFAHQLLLFSLPWLPETYSRLGFQFYRKGLRGQQAPFSLQSKAVSTAQHYATPLLTRLYKERYADPKRKKEVTELVTELLTFAQERLRTVEWLDPKTRDLAKEKVVRMRASIGYPEELEAVSIPPLDPSDVLGNLFSLGEAQTAHEYATLGQPISKRKDWDEPIFAVNAYYYEQANELILPYGILHSPFYDSTRSLGWNYGGIGCTVCHELTHAFDEDGKEYGPDGTQNPWWTASDTRNYEKQTHPLVELFDTQKVNGIPVNGKKTLSENLADLGGMGIALDALRHKLDAMKLTQEERNQMYRDFFVSYAVSWRLKERKKKRLQASLVDRHAPPSLRVNLVVSQFQEWYDAFAITPEDALYLPPEKRLRIF
jgi:putative endopeptidase